MKQAFDKGFFAPLPVLIIGSYDEKGTPDAMNAAWGGQAGMTQISVSLSGSHKTTANIKLNREFTVAYATADQIAACDFVGIVSGNNMENKLEKCGFTVTKSDKVNAPIIDQLPVAIECRVIEIQEEFNETRIVAEIVGLKADENVMTDGKVDYSKAGFVIYDTVTKCYRAVGESVAAARSVGKKFDIV
ncbi:MAG: flavin reductase family protein [Ruminococcus sp.]|uniref:flavin reductase family protein n=1 Tax=Ruminococcus sp. TaxID=41978 RepID=UPI0025EABEB4|nr:flavin reductase family protein [Ruminococcus sp.]MBR5683766.1 flavin reductase family protein [Ruminococcus sp.]